LIAPIIGVAVNMATMGPELGELAFNIVRWLDDSFLGFVACEFTDAAGRVHTIEDKVRMVSVE
jgi:hypothetical protein